MLCALLLCGAGAAQAQVDLSGLDRDMAGPRAQVLVLGSAHLAEHADGDFDPATLEPLLARLAAFAPDVITVESISGVECDFYARHPARFPSDAVGRYCPDTGPARDATGLDVPAAAAAVEATLRDWPEAPTPAQRRRLASLFLAAGETDSALVQWWQLPAAERRAGDGLDAALVTQMRRREASPNESRQVGARLAARLGLARVHATDDHTGDNVDIPADRMDAYAAALYGAWETASAQLEPINARADALAKSGDMLALYRYMNRIDVRQATADGDFASALRVAASQPWGQMYVAGWETRNLRMVANIRATFAARPGARVLSIVGASHKPWFDSLLGQMQGVDIVDVDQVLGPDGDAPVDPAAEPGEP
ncbi:DUF5694 domain-containing protein [Luteimonas sp. BDR2-5]|uniref:DUF5694 domain-containing protein n=1 Tax=Proluteimonas luteida TaxID=2878685 RepID=UPI001E63A103|nr:DUF5694 domain-containing protein [Luteimonas sp. BDR2-5]MCD9028189.1 DUF5694 domain-containing protein [Luteimonas sp. BDR2-5]